MEKQLARLAVAQVLLVVYAVFAGGVMLKIARTFPSMLQFPSAHLAAVNYCLGMRDYGIWLLLVPAAWSAAALWIQHRPASDTSTFTSLYLSGLGAVGLLVLAAVKSTAVLFQLIICA